MCAIAIKYHATAHLHARMAGAVGQFLTTHAPEQESAPVDPEGIYKMADALYEKGYDEGREECDYAPRASKEWQAVVGAVGAKPEAN